MRKILQLPVIRDLYARSLLFPIVLAVVVAVVLLQGALRKEPAEQELSSIEVTTALPDLSTHRPDLEKTPLTYVSDYWLQVGEQSRRKLVLLGRDKTPAVVISPGLALTTMETANEIVAEQLERKLEVERQQTLARQTAGQSRLTSAKDQASRSKPTSAVAPAPEPEPAPQAYTLVGVDREHELALFALHKPYQATAFPSADPENLKPGSHVAAVSLTPFGRLRILPGVLVSAHAGVPSRQQAEVFDVSISFPADMPLAAIVDLDGGLLGVAVESSDGIRLLSAETVNLVAERLQEKLPCQSIEISELTPETRKILRLTGGVFVEKVRTEAFSPKPSIQPGDVLLEWNSMAIADPPQFNRLYQNQEPGTLVRYRALRNQEPVRGGTIMPGPDCRPATQILSPFARLGVILQWREMKAPGGSEAMQGWKVMGVVEDTPAARAGLARNDWIVSVGGRLLALPSARKPFEEYEQQPRPMVLTVRRNDRVKLVAISPPKA